MQSIPEVSSLSVEPTGRLALLLKVVVLVGVCVAVWKLVKVGSLWGNRWLILRELGWLAAPIIVAITFVGIGWQVRPVVRSDAASTGMTWKINASAARDLIPAAEDPFRGASQEPGKSSNRPAWVAKSHSGDGIRERIVVSSGQYSTKSEAEQELLGLASEVVRQDLQKWNSLGHWGGTWHPDHEDVVRYAVKQQHCEAVETDFVSFSHPMYRIWWQIELSPAVRAEFLTAWHRAVIGTRILSVGIVASTVVMLASLVAMYYRIDARMQQKRRVALKVLLTGGAAVWLGLVRCLADGRFW